MQIALYRALQSIKLTDEAATAVVEALEEHMAKEIAEAVKPLETKIEEVKTRLTWLATIFGVAAAAVPLAIALAPTIAKLAG